MGDWRYTVNIILSSITLANLFHFLWIHDHSHLPIDILILQINHPLLWSYQCILVSSKVERKEKGTCIIRPGAPSCKCELNFNIIINMYCEQVLGEKKFFNRVQRQLLKLQDGKDWLRYWFLYPQGPEWSLARSRYPINTYSIK